MSRNRGQVFESLAVGSLEQLFFVSITKLSGRCFCSLRPPCLCPSKGHKHGVAIQSSVNLGDTLLRITRKKKKAETRFLVRLFIYQLSIRVTNGLV